MFAAGGLHGTPTTEVAKASGISQAYPLRLCSTKAELFAALTQRTNARVHDAMARAAADAKAAARTCCQRWDARMAARLADVQPHSHAASDNPAIRDQMRRFVELVEREARPGPDEVRALFAQGMLPNVLAPMGANDVDARWARVLLSPPKGECC